MQKWENTEIVVFYDKSSGGGYWADNPAYLGNLTERLNMCGADGWELAATYTIVNEQQTELHYCLKRPFG
jgi:hypothetical protein